MDTEVTLLIGDLVFFATLGDDPKYVPGKKFATIALGDFVETANGSERFRKVGYVRVSWAGKKLRVVLICRDLDFAGMSGVGASSYVELAEPGITVKGGGEPIFIDLTLGDILGDTECNSFVTSKTTLRKIGRPSSDLYEEHLLSSVTLKTGTNVTESPPIEQGAVQ